MCSFMCCFSQPEHTAHYKKSKNTVQPYSDFFKNPLNASIDWLIDCFKSS